MISRRALITGLCLLPSTLQADNLLFSPPAGAFFEAVGAALPWAVPNLQPSAFYVSSTNVTWVFFNGWNGSTVPQVMTYNHGTLTWSGPFTVGPSVIQNDVHGAPTAVRDSSGYVYAFFGSHTSAISVASTASPDVPSTWTQRTGLSGAHTFPKPFFVGSKLYLFYTTNPSGEGSLSLVQATVSSGVPTWGAAVSLFDFSDLGGEWIMPGTFWQNGTDIHMVFCTFNSAASNGESWDVFYAIYDTTTGNVRNYSGGSVIAPGSQPISNATAAVNFRIVNQTATGHFGMPPSLCIDGAGASHVLYADAAGQPGTASLLHITNSGASWSAPHTIFTYPSMVYANNVDAAVVPNAAGGIDVYYPDGSRTDALGSFGPLASGSMFKITRSSGGTWGSAAQIADGSGKYGLDDPAVIPGGHANARVAFTQVSFDEQTVSGYLGGYLYGDAGFILR
jgi:hypothetical protein